MPSHQALRAARLLGDPGVHVLGWTRERAIQPMLDNSTESRESVESAVDWHIAVPGQATACLTGASRIQELRDAAEAALGARFDIKGLRRRRARRRRRESADART